MWEVMVRDGAKGLGLEKVRVGSCLPCPLV